MVYAPLERPAPPIPAMARPTMRVVELLATAQMRLPSSKMNMLIKKTIFKGKNFRAFPHVLWKAATVRKKADPYLYTSVENTRGSVAWISYQPT